MLDPAPPPEADRGVAPTGAHPELRAPHERGRVALCVASTATPTPAPSSSCSAATAGLLHGDEHPPPGRASGDRDGDRHRPRQGADPHRRRRAHDADRATEAARATPSSAASTPRTRSLLPSPGPAHHLPHCRARRARRHPRLRGRRQIPPYYDSLIAKVIAHGTRPRRAVARIRRALDFFVDRGRAHHHPAPPRHPPGTPTSSPVGSPPASWSVSIPRRIVEDPTVSVRLTRDRVPSLYAIADADVLGLQRVPEAVEDHGRRPGSRGSSSGPSAPLTPSSARTGRVLAAGLSPAAGPHSGSTIDTDLAAIYALAGVHVGASDLPPAAARAVVGHACSIGSSTHDLEQLSAADADPDCRRHRAGPDLRDPAQGCPRSSGRVEASSRARSHRKAADRHRRHRRGERCRGARCRSRRGGAAPRGLLGRRRPPTAIGWSLVGAGGRRRGGPIYLTGFMGAGKTAWGSDLAATARTPFVDLDHEIEQRLGTPCPDLFRERGEPSSGARVRGARGVEQNCSVGVIATGGGVVECAQLSRSCCAPAAMPLAQSVPFDTLIAAPRRLRKGRAPPV